MAQTASTLNSRVGTGNESLLRSVRRSRFSLHFKTPNTRRWLLVQWVSAPVQATTEWLDKLAQRLNHEREQSRSSLSNLFEQYRLDTTLRRTI
jgi:hypothetical protein